MFIAAGGIQSDLGREFSRRIDEYEARAAVFFVTDEAGAAPSVEVQMNDPADGSLRRRIGVEFDFPEVAELPPGDRRKPVGSRYRSRWRQFGWEGFRGLITEPLSAPQL